MPRRTHLLAAGLAALTLVGLLAVPALADSRARSSQFMVDTAQYRNALTDLSLTASRSGNLVRVRNVQASLDLGRGWENAYGAYAELRVDGRTVARSHWQPDTNGDARLQWWFPSLRLRSHQTVSVWFSDPVSRYRITHPWIIV